MVFNPRCSVNRECKKVTFLYSFMLYLSLKCFNALFVVTLSFADRKKDLTFIDMLKFYFFVIRSSSGLITFTC